MVRDEPGQHVVMKVDVARKDGLSLGVDHPSIARDRNGTGFPNCHDSAVADHDITVFDDLVAFHGDEPCAAKSDGASGPSPGSDDADVDPLEGRFASDVHWTILPRGPA